MSRQPSGQVPKRGWGISGADIIGTAKKEEQEAKERAARQGELRFFLKKETEAEIIILDKNIESAFALFEHTIVPNGRWEDTYFETSLKTLGQDDPLEIYPVVYGKTSKADYITFLSVLDITPYEVKGGPNAGKKILFSRKLLPIKRTQVADFKKLSDNAVAKFGTMRGLHLVMRRDGSDTSPRIGKPAPLDTMEYGHLTDAELLQKYAHPEVKSQQGKVLVPANGMIQPFDYYSIFKEPSLEDIRQRYGLDAPLGSNQANKDAWGSSVDSALAEEATDQTPSMNQEPTANHNSDFITDDEMADQIPF